ncbi:hypothetical protein BPS26883_05631 [Burkholderia pseudomultivorans]|uniref:Uncharacterized protein n=1 Tax=Burkholderia pseudomultivorans TaxID=1207504 RepID=A0A6P2Q3R0_9BURK|nr:hypothetical protein BPS26883_05631 [Burkholderia pseudomultivorans]
MRGRGVVGHEEHAVDDLRNRVELMVQVRERRALAGDIDEVGLAAVQQEAAVAEQFERVAHRHRRLDVSARHPDGGPVLIVAAVARVEADVREQLPGRALRGAARRDLAGLGAAVDLDERGIECGLGLAGQLFRQRRGGRQHERRARQRVAGRQQRAQVDRRRDEHARLRDRGEFVANVDRIERLAVAECEPADQREQHRRFEAVHVLRGHRADQRGRAAVEQAEALGRRAHAADQEAPGLAVRHRRAGRTGREHVGHDAARVDLRHLERRIVGAGLDRGFGVREARQVDRAVGRVVQAERIGRERRELAHHFGRVRRRQQADPAGDERRAQAHGEPVAVAAHVEHVAAGGQRGGHARDVGDERAHGDGCAVAPRDDLVGRRMEYQRMSRHKSAETETGAGARHAAPRRP